MGTSFIHSNRSARSGSITDLCGLEFMSAEPISTRFWKNWPWLHAGNSICDCAIALAVVPNILRKDVRDVNASMSLQSESERSRTTRLGAAPIAMRTPTLYDDGSACNERPEPKAS